MSDSRPWFREPETFIALAALVVSLSAVAVGIYEASLQRTHDRAEVWPHVELATYTTPKSATLTLENTGIGPAVVGSIVVSVDGTARRNWPDALEALFGALPKTYSVTTMGDRAMRPGEKTVIVEVPADQLPPGFWQYIGRVGVSICYASVFGEHWTMSVPKLGGKPTWTPNSGCPPQRDSTDF